jgi:putative DNA methylase
MKKALAGIAKASSDAPATIYYAFKQSELSEEGITSAGWASFLQAVTDSTLAVDGTWPIRSELGNRMTASGTNALASSIVLVCRHRPASATTITRADFLRVLRREMPDALAEIRRAGVGPTDIQQAAIGPGIGIFTRHASVLSTDGTPLLVKDALKLINQVREEITSTSDADYDSETRFALDWFAAKGFDKGKSGDAIVMTNAVNVSLDGMNAVGFFEARGGDARLLKREELPDWDPADDARGTVWEACQHLVKRLSAEDGGSTRPPPSTIGWGHWPIPRTLLHAAFTISASRTSGRRRATSTTSSTKSGIRSRSALPRWPKQDRRGTCFLAERGSS